VVVYFVQNGLGTEKIGSQRSQNVDLPDEVSTALLVVVTPLPEEIEQSGGIEDDSRGGFCHGNPSLRT
jgi:hypothetical protein